MRKFLFLFVLFFVISPAGAEVVQEGLVLTMDAAKAGSDPVQRWCPAFGSRDSGDLFAYLDSDLPTHHYETVAGGYIWYYNFAPVLTGRSGVGGYIGVEDVANPGSYITNFDYDADFSIEAWIRPGAEPIEQDRGIIISDQAGCNGWRFGIRDAGNDTWYFDFVMRDCSGTTYYILLSSNGKFNGLYNSEDWVHVILTYDGQTNLSPVAEMYVNGVELNINQSTTDMSGASETDFVPVADHLTIGVRDWQRTDIYGGMLPFDGDISLVQIYNKVLTAGEAVNNYAEGMTVNEGLSCGSLPGDLNSDCSVDLFDLLIMSNRWLVNVGRATWPYKVLFNNDTTNITTALSPYNTIDDRDFTVDIVTASGDYFTVHDSDIAAMIKMIPGTPVLLEMHYTTCSGYDENGDFSLRRTTDNQFYTAAHLAYSRGAAGISTYNFQYYRASEEDQAGYFSEPPFRIFEHIADADWVAAQPQHYVLATTWMTTQYTFTMPLKFMTAGDSNTFEMDMAPPRGGWTTEGKLKIQAFDDLGTSQWTATCNGVILVEMSDVSEPYNNPYPNLMDSDTMRRAWIVPSSILVNGINHFELTMNVGTETAMVRFIDLSI